MTKTFTLCVRILQDAVDYFGMTYEEINVIIFVINWPLLTLALLGVIIFQRKRLRIFTGARLPFET